MATEAAHRKILYRRQAFPDNYSGEDFLAGLRTNVTAVHYSLLQAVTGASVAMLQADIAILFLLLFSAVLDSRLSSSHVLLAIGVASLVGYLAFTLLSGRVNPMRQLIDHGSTVVVILSFGYGLTPIIRTLTDTISTDTIYAMTCVLILASLFFHDYGMDAPMSVLRLPCLILPVACRVSSALSFNLSLAGAVCLVSRVADSSRAFAVLATAQVLFGHWPHLRQLLPNHASLVILSVIAPIEIVLLARLSPLLALLHCLVHLCVCLLCPLILIRMQPLKSTIHGPWDEATPLTALFLLDL